MGEAGSVNGHTLTDGRFCLSFTRVASDEYSGRGRNVATWLLIAGADAVELCGYHPLRLLESALAAGWMRMDVTQEVMLLGRSQPANLEALAQACSVFPAETLAALVERVGSAEPVGVLIEREQRLLIDAIFSLLPLSDRTAASFTTGLLPSAKRPFHLHLLAPQTDVKNLFTRVIGRQLCDPSDLQVQATTDTGRKLAELLVLQRWSEAKRLVLGP